MIANRRSECVSAQGIELVRAWRFVWDTKRNWLLYISFIESNMGKKGRSLPCECAKYFLTAREYSVKANNLKSNKTRKF